MNKCECGSTDLEVIKDSDIVDFRGFRFKTDFEFSECKSCGKETIFTNQIKKNDKILLKNWEKFKKEQAIKDTFPAIAKEKGAYFRNNCVKYARENGLNKDNIPESKEFEDWLLTYTEQLEVYRNQLHLRCEYTGDRVSMSQLQIDHKQPKSRGGNDSTDNLAITSAQNNQRKGDLTDTEFSELLEFIRHWTPRAKDSVLTRLRTTKKHYRYSKKQPVR